MTFGGNTQPKKPSKKSPSPGWDCACRRNPGYLIRCPKCGKGRP